MWCLIVASEAGWKSTRSLSSVTISVFDGGEGLMSCGRLEKSRERLSGDFEPRLEERLEDSVDEGLEAGMLSVIVKLFVSRYAVAIC